MDCQRSAPSSPRAPKIQQESWDDCDSPPIDLFDPCQYNSPTRTKNPPKSPKSPRKFNKPIPYCEARSSSKSSRSSFSSSGEQRSPKYDNPPRSPKITTTYANDDNDDESTTGSFYQTPPGSRSPKPTLPAIPGSAGVGGGSANPAPYYYDAQQSPRRSPNSPRKFVFDAISPSYEKKGRKFEYYDSQIPSASAAGPLDILNDDDDDEDDNNLHDEPNRFVRSHPLRSQTPPSLPSSLPSSSSFVANHQQGGVTSTSVPVKAQNLGQNYCNVGGGGSGSGKQRRESKNFTMNIFKAGPSDVVSSSLNGGAKLSKNCNRYPQQPHLLLDEFPTGTRGVSLYMKRDSCMTESTQLSGDSCETNATTLTTTTTFISSSADEQIAIVEQQQQQQQSCSVSRGGGSSGGVNCNSNIPSNGGGQLSPKCTAGGSAATGGNDKASGIGGGNKQESGRRRHAINITSNPAYQVLHGSHSTLDRTCSDSIVSLKYRKSTSDLTDVEDSGTPVVSKPRRRGSSKGGLAYLASRRSSRDSVKSICSNTSNFSNEDIGPLAFQASGRSRQRRTSNFLELPIPDHIRPRVCSLPDRPYNPRVSDDLYRLRHFSISKGTVVNCGDSIISRRSRSNTSVNSTTSRASERSPFEGSCCGGGYANVDSMPPSPTDSEPPPPPRYRIVMLGDSGVGKTALVSQFMTSEYMHTYDASLVLDDEFGEKTVSVLLDDEESELVFIDHPSVEMSVENSLTTYEPHACVVIYSVVDRNSFRVAEEIVNYLWSESLTKDKAVILVGNKADLARARVITMSEGKSLAASRDAKFIETSSGIQHNVDELLVGILKQIRLKEKRDKKAAMTSSKMKNSRTQMSLHLAKEILQKICLSDITKSKSCENLHVL